MSGAGTGTGVTGVGVTGASVADGVATCVPASEAVVTGVAASDGVVGETSQPVLASARGVTFTYGRRGPGPAQVDPQASPALSDVDLDLIVGTCTLLTGRSGCGKSTLLKLFNGLVPHHDGGRLTGTVRVGDLAVPEVALHVTGEHVATVFQNPRTQFYTTDVTSELAFASENLGRNPEDIRRRIREVAASTGISSLLGRSLFALSGGQRQLVACAAAQVQQPDLYLFDEPTSNLSPAAVRSFREFLLALRASGATILVTEHRLHYLRGLVDTAVIMSEGSRLTRMSGEAFFAMSPQDRARHGLRSLEPVHSRPSVVVAANAGPTTVLAGPVPSGPVPSGPVPSGPVPSVSVAAGQVPSVSAAPSVPSGPVPSGSVPWAGLSLRGVRAGYRGRTVLDIDALDLPAGLVTAVTGPNGAGKSTLAHVVCGLRRASGSITLDGQRMRARALTRAGYLVMQDVHRQLFSDTVAGELTLGVRHGREPDTEAVLERFGLAGTGARHPLTLSGGQKQRLVVAAATTMRKRVYVFDEPSSGLDRAHLDAVAATLRSLAKEGAVVLLITHDDELIAACADAEVQLRSLERDR